MPARGIQHIAITVNDLGISEPFYDKLMELLGFTKSGVPEQRLVFYSSPDTNIVIAGARPENKGAVFDRFRVGLHHLAFRVESRTEVETVHRALARAGGTILDAPAEYPQYMPGYYAAYFADPDGIKLEVVHTPGTPAPAAAEPDVAVRKPVPAPAPVKPAPKPAPPKPPKPVKPPKPAPKPKAKPKKAAKKPTAKKSAPKKKKR